MVRSLFVYVENSAVSHEKIRSAQKCYLYSRYVV